MLYRLGSRHVSGVTRGNVQPRVNAEKVKDVCVGHVEPLGTI